MKPTKKVTRVELYRPGGGSTIYFTGADGIKSIKCLGSTVIITGVNGLEEKYVGLPYVASYED